jgi:D-glycero-alpha-D-manno-heptose-7-phosphate kinase
MIITRTPFRVSFVGGGTDLRAYYQNETGRVLSTGINKYVYVLVKKQLGIVEHKYRINWSQTEFKNEIDEIDHPIVREVLRKFNIDYPIEITTVADIPAGTGLGSSSSFAVGLIHAICALEGIQKTKFELASIAAEIEVDILGRNMGKQDHFAASYGNLNIISFFQDETVEVESIPYDSEKSSELEHNLILFYTYLKRDASDILKTQAEETKRKFEVLTEMKNLVQPLSETLMANGSIDNFGRILHKNWMLKKSLTNEIANDEISSYYQKGIDAGALGGKLLGAGGGGFLLFYVKLKHREQLIKALNKLYPLSFKFDRSGTRVTYYDRGDQ